MGRITANDGLHCSSGWRKMRIQINANESTERRISLPHYKRGEAYLNGAGRRFFDISFASCFMVVLLPLMLIIGIMVKATSSGPVIYLHKRVGKGGKVLYIYKFRTMIDQADQKFDLFSKAQMEEWERNYKVTNDPRVTWFGRILRVTSLDELPQLLNILKGEMSVIGPRPIIESELELYGRDKARFLSVKPGWTGYWQAFARSECSYEDRMKMELMYIDNACLRWDLKILTASVLRVLSCRGAK